MTKWYAVMSDRNDNDWGYGSYDLDEAIAMVLESRSVTAYIAVIDDDAGVCVDEIEQSGFF